MPSRIDIVIVNWNAGGLLRRCLASVPDAVVEGVEIGRIVVVDNASTDGSLDDLPAIQGLEIQRNPQNRGFAAACNQGAQESTADYLLFLNPDTVLRPDSLAPVVAFLEQPDRQKVGAAGARLVDEAGETQRTCARFPTPNQLIARSLGLDRILPRLFPPHFLLEWDHLDTRPVHQVMGAFLLIRRELFDRIHGFDERFFVYFEDVDLCARVWMAGAMVAHVAEAVAVHTGHGTTAQVPDVRLFYALRSRLLFAAKHFPRVSTIRVALVTLITEPAIRIVRALALGRVDEAAATLRAAGWLWQALPGMIRSGGRPY